MTKDASTAADVQVNPGSNRGFILLLLCIVPFSEIPMDIYTPALPAMVTELHSTNVWVQNTVTFYMLGMGLGLVPIGMLADAIGRKKTLLIFLGVLTVTSIACALANNIFTLIAFRFVQGIGGCACLVTIFAMAADRFRGAELTSVSGYLGVTWGLAPVIAPAAGGFLVQYASWRVIFELLAVMVGILFVCSLLFLPETLPAKMRAPVRVREAVTVLGGALRNMHFVCFTLIFAVIASGQMVFGVVAPFLYQVNMGYSAVAYGMIALGLGGANLLGELGCGTLATRTTPRQLCFGAWLFFACGAAVLVLTGADPASSFMSLTVGGALSLVGCGVLCPTANGMAMGIFSHNLGLISGFISAICCLGVSITMAVAAYMPETSQAPLAWLYVALAVVSFVLLFVSLSPEKTETVPVLA